MGERRGPMYPASEGLAPAGRLPWQITAFGRFRQEQGRTKIVQTNGEADLSALGRELTRLRRRTRRLREYNWTSWSAAVEEANSLVRQINPVQPRSLEDLVVRYDALHWQLIEADDAIVDAVVKRAFIDFGRALKRMTGSR